MNLCIDFGEAPLAKLVKEGGGKWNTTKNLKTATCSNENTMLGMLNNYVSK
jgi:hypothetical protein